MSPTRSTLRRLGVVAVLALAPAAFGDGLADALRSLDANVHSTAERRELSRIVANDIERRRRLAIERENRAWAAVTTRADWERFRDARIAALRRALGPEPPAAASPAVHVAARLEGDGCRIENLVFESRPGLFVTANLYVPEAASRPAPAVILSHSHHAPKTQGELQDMGTMWARHGWVVLVMDHLGHGERRQHPFADQESYTGEFRLGRQDYWFRYNVGLGLALAGESLMGWMVHDLRRGVDLLAARDDVDDARIALIGAVAGGGDPAGVAAALDARIAAVAPFNFGGPQPDYPIPANAESEFYWFGVAYWETTRCLRLGGRDGFAHWVIVGSTAPRGLIYSHEFSWDAARDPAWPRLERVYGFYDARDRLASATGRGTLAGQPPESTHCNNVGPEHRRGLYPHLERWLAMAPPPEDGARRRDPRDLLCLTPELRESLAPRAVHDLAREIAAEKLQAARRRRDAADPAARVAALRHDWAALLGDIEPRAEPRVLSARRERAQGLDVERVALEVEPGITVPLVLLRAASKRDTAAPARTPVVVITARPGKSALVERRAAAIALLIASGAAVCLPDLRGTGETSPGGHDGPSSAATTLSCRDQVLGGTLPGARLRDLRSVLRFLRGRDGLGGPVALWGESLAEVNPAGRSEVVPHGASDPNVHAEPTAGLIALLAALCEDEVRCVVARGALASFASLLASPFLYVPHDAVVPGALAVSDVDDVIACLAPRPVRIEAAVDGRNRAVGADAAAAAVLERARSAYAAAGAADALRIEDAGDAEAAARWVVAALSE